MAPAAVQPPEIQFAQRLAANEKRIRDRALKKLRGYISVRTQRPDGRAWLGSARHCPARRCSGPVGLLGTRVGPVAGASGVGVEALVERRPRQAGVGSGSTCGREPGPAYGSPARHRAATACGGLGGFY